MADAGEAEDEVEELDEEFAEVVAMATRRGFSVSLFVFSAVLSIVVVFRTEQRSVLLQVESSVQPARFRCVVVVGVSLTAPHGCGSDCSSSPTLFSFVSQQN